MVRRVAAGAALLLMGVAALAAPPAVPGAKPTPYWASIKAGEARMRSGPGRNYPATWLYRRAGLPVQVVEVYPGWRKIRDPDGATGWMVQSLISGGRTAIVAGGVAELHETASAASRVAWRAEPGVVGRISQCADGWCRFDVTGRAGFVATDRLWGVDRLEAID